MVEKMKKIHLLMATADTETVLADLQKIGVVHIETGAVADDSGVMDLGSRIMALKKTNSELKSHAEGYGGEPHDSEIAESKIVDVEILQLQTREIQAELARYAAESDRLQKDLAALAPWGRFDPSIMSRLEEAGVRITYHILPLKAFEAADFSDRHIEIIREDKTRIYFIEICRSGMDKQVDIPLFPEERLFKSGPDEVRRLIGGTDSAVKKLESRLTVLTLSRSIIVEEILSLESERERRLAALSLGNEVDGEVMCLTGFIPVSLVPGLESFLEERSILPLITDSEQPGETPIKLKNGPVARLFEPITKIFGFPQYLEIDTTPFFAPFFAFFFGLCLADVGYGIIVTLSALAGFFLLKKKALKSLAALGFILGLTTVIGGLFLNTLFGMKIDSLPNLPEGVASLLLFRDINDAMAFSILLGVVQILIGFIMQVVNKWRQDGFTASLQPAGTFLLIIGTVVWAVGNMGSTFAVGPIPVGAWIAMFGNTGGIGLGLAAFGVLLILFFNNPGKKFWIRPLLGLWEMYGIASGVPGDILSYIRLFALALAGGLLGGAINLIALMIRGDDPGFFSWIFMLLVLIGGHFINFALAALGAFVHPLRLTFVEFYKAVGFKGGGIPYAPYGGKTS